MSKQTKKNDNFSRLRKIIIIAQKMIEIRKYMYIFLFVLRERMIPDLLKF